MCTEEKGPEEWVKLQERCGGFLSAKCEDQDVTAGTLVTPRAWCERVPFFFFFQLKGCSVAAKASAFMGRLEVRGLI